jgi:hypothetical protein
MLEMANLFTHLGQVNLCELMTCEKPIGKKDSTAQEESSRTNFMLSPRKIRTFIRKKKPPEGGFFSEEKTYFLAGGKSVQLP